MKKKLLTLCLCLLTGSMLLQAQKARSRQIKKTPVKSNVVQKQVSSNDKQIRLEKGQERLVEITTPFGIMVAKLYNATPLHRDNFIKLVEQGFYDSLLFHRVINQFMIQGGDPSSKHAAPDEMLGGGSAPGEKIPAEFNPSLFHKKGALAAARDNNAQKASSNCQFYIVEGKPIEPASLNQNKTVSYTPAQTEIYERIGGSPFLDQNYTVFGEVISGLDVVDKISALQKNANNRPLVNVTMKMKMLN